MLSEIALEILVRSMLSTNVVSRTQVKRRLSRMRITRASSSGILHVFRVLTLLVSFLQVIGIAEGGVIPTTLVYLGGFYKSTELGTRLAWFWGVQVNFLTFIRCVMM